MSMFSPNTTAPAGGVRGAVATFLRSVGSGYDEVARVSSQQADAGMAHPVDGVVATTNILRDSTQRVPILNKITAGIDRFAGIGVATAASQVVEGYERQGATVSNVAHTAADLLDGQHSAEPRPFKRNTSAVDGRALLAASDTGEFLAALGIR